MINLKSGWYEYDKFSIHDDVYSHCLTIFYLLMSKTGTAVGDSYNDEGQQNIDGDNTSYCPRLNSVAGHCALWQTRQLEKKTKTVSKMEQTSRQKTQSMKWLEKYWFIPPDEISSEFPFVIHVKSWSKRF